MANSYKSNKFTSEFGKAQITGDPEKKQPSFDTDLGYTDALNKFKAVVQDINGQLDKTSQAVKKLSNHADSGKETRNYCSKVTKKVEAVKQALTNSLNTFTNNINNAWQAEQQRMYKWYMEAQQVDAKNSATEIKEG